MQVGGHVQRVGAVAAHGLDAKRKLPPSGPGGIARGHQVAEGVLAGCVAFQVFPEVALVGGLGWCRLCERHVTRVRAPLVVAPAGVGGQVAGDGQGREQGVH